MTLVVFFFMAIFVLWICKFSGKPITFSDADCIVLAILAGAEVISWRCKK